MGCSSCAKRALEIQQRLQQQGTLEEGSLARPKAPWFPPMYTFKDEQDPPNEFEDPDLNTLMAKVIQFRHENSLPDIAYLHNVILHYTMMSNPIYEQHIEWYVPDATVHLSVKQYALSALAYVKATTHTPENIFVDQETAELRAATCLNCPRNVPKVNGRTRDDQGFGQSRFAQLAKDRHTSVDNLLHLCGTCTCLLKAKVHFTQEFIEDATTEELLRQFTQEYVGLNGRPHTCWIGKAYLEKRANNGK